MQNISKAMGAHFYWGQNTQKFHNFGQEMSKWLLGDVKLNITRSPDPEILVFLHVPTFALAQLRGS